MACVSAKKFPNAVLSAEGKHTRRPRGLAQHSECLYKRDLGKIPTCLKLATRPTRMSMNVQCVVHRGAPETQRRAAGSPGARVCRAERSRTNSLRTYELINIINNSLHEGLAAF